MRAKHSRFNRVATIIISSFALVATLCIALVLVLSSEHVIDIKSEEDHIYQARFFVDNSLVYETKKKKGEVIGYGYGNPPLKDKDVDGQPYVFIGWDLTGEGIIDILPNRIYGNFDARAVFAKFGIPDIDWTKVDFNKILDLLNALNIDLESFMNFFGLTMEDMLDLLNVPVINYDTNYRGVVYLRNESFADYNQTSHKWNNASYYSSSNISAGSINPSQYAFDKISRVLPDKTNEKFTIEPLKKGSNYPVLCYEKDRGLKLDSDSVSLTSFNGTTYESTGLPYSYVNSDIIALLKGVPFSSNAITQDELKYREYVYDNYLHVDDNIKQYLTSVLNSNDIHFDKSYHFIDKIYKFFKNGYKFNFSMDSYPLSSDPVIYFLKDSKEGIGRHFAASTTLLFRTLGVPARYVQGYVDNAEDGDNVISALQAHSWCEIYVDGVGWLDIDTAIHCISDVDLSYLFNSDEDLDFEEPPEGSVDGVSLKSGKLSYQLGEKFDASSITLNAHYDSGETREVKPTSFIPNSPNMNKIGKQTITAVYHEDDSLLYTTFEIEVTTDVMEIYVTYQENTFTKQYTGFSVFEEQDLYNALEAGKIYFTDEDDNRVDINNYDYLITLTYDFISESDASSFEEMIDVSGVNRFYYADVSAEIRDRRTGQILPNYTVIPATVEFTITEMPLYVVSDSVTITSSALSDEYGGVLSLHQIGLYHLVNARREVLDNFDYLIIDEVTGWSELKEYGKIENKYNTASVRIYRYGVDVTSNYSLQFEYGFLEVKD